MAYKKLKTAKNLGVSKKELKRLKKGSPFEQSGMGIPYRKTGRKNIKRAKNPKEYMEALGTYTIRKDLYKGQEGDWSRPRKKKPPVPVSKMKKMKIRKLKTSYGK